MMGLWKRRRWPSLQANADFITLLEEEQDIPESHFIKPKYGTVIFLVLALPVFYTVSRYNYNLFHSFADGVSIVIAASTFTIIWTSRHRVDNDYFLYIGISFLFFAFLDLLHLLGNKNMGVFPAYGNLGPTFYIASRYILSISFLAAPFFISRRLNTTIMFTAYSLITLLILLSVFYWEIFPVCYIEGVGLTSFKVTSDYIICLSLSGAAGLLLANRQSFDPRVLWIIVASIIFSIATGLTFTLYTDPFGITNTVGHIFQIASFCLVYLAFIETSLTKPQDILFRRLKQNEEKLTKNVEQLDRANMELNLEIAERMLAERELSISRIFLEISNKYADLSQLLHAFADETQRLTHCEAVGIRLLDEKGNIPYLAYRGFSSQFYEQESPLSIRTDKCMCINVIKGTTDPALPFYTEGGSFFMNGTSRFLATVSDEDKGQTRNACNKTGYESVALIPIRTDKLILGLIHLADRKENMVPADMIKTLEQVAVSLGVGVQRALAEAALAANAAKLTAINKELESFSYSVSHDLRAPLRAIDGYAGMILKRQSDHFNEDTKHRFQVIRNNVKKMGNLIDDLLAFSRLGRQDLKKTGTDMEALIHEVWEELVTINSGRTMTLQMDPIPAALGDRTLIRQVYSNLLGNAVKFANTRETIVVEVGSFFEDNERVYYVKDNGIGFDMKYYDKLFNVFSRLHSTDEYEGTGIGLALVQRIIHRHGGRIWAEGKVGEGASFYFTL